MLYGTLRLRFGPAPAAAASAAVFALAHSYGVIGFVSVLMSGVLWAITYERTRSRLPGMLAHAANNPAGDRGRPRDPPLLARRLPAVREVETVGRRSALDRYGCETLTVPFTL